MSVDRSGGANNGNIYITWPQINVAPAGTDPDIVCFDRQMVVQHGVLLLELMMMQ